MHNHCQNCINVKKCSKESNTDEACPIIRCLLECGRKFHSCKLDEHKYLCVNELVSCINKGYGCPFRVYRHRMSAHLPSCPASVVQCTLILDHWPVYPPLDKMSKSKNCEELYDNKNIDESFEKPNSFLNVDVASEIASSVMSVYSSWNTFRPYLVNPEQRYTFACAQAFRRDEYNWHYKNIHNDIHYSLNGLIIERCPLAQYGCRFSRKRLYPAPKGSLLVYDNVNGGFGIVPLPLNAVKDFSTRLQMQCPNLTENIRASNTICDNNEPEDVLSSLPFEILQKIAQNLDSFSLGNLALTSQHLRNVCNTLLEERGLVVIQWKKEKLDGRVTWNISNFKWFFSKSIDPVSHWCYLEGKNISDHMQGCPFNEKRVLKTEHMQRIKLFDPANEF